MDDNTARLIVAALEKERLALPEAPHAIAFLNARRLPGLPVAWRERLACEQGFRPFLIDLRDAGFSAEPVLGADAGGYAGAIVLAGRIRRANEAMIARGWEMLADGAPILVAGANTDGIKSLRKWVSERVRVGESLSKHHGVAFVIHRSGSNPFDGGNALPISPAMFSASAVDAGSHLLAEFIDERICGTVADFGAGTGFLSCEVARSGGSITRLDAYEADYLSLEAAKLALAETAPELERRFFWRDLLREPPTDRYDWIVMNPPFHQTRLAEPELGSAFVRLAADALKPRGRLLMVANRQLPYELVVNRCFAGSARLAEGPVYKVIEAWKR